MSKLTDLAALQDADGFQTEFESRLSDKVADALEMRKVDVAQNFFADVQHIQNEEVEELDELSKKTLGSYIKKASEKAIQHAHAQDVEDLMRRDRDPSLVRHHADKKWKRLKGINKATDKLAQEEVEELDEREMTAAEMDKREKIVKGMKKSVEGFRKRYGSRAKDVMYATATKQAMD